MKDQKKMNRERRRAGKGKRILASALALSMAFSLAACGGETTETEGSGNRDAGVTEEKTTAGVTEEDTEAVTEADTEEDTGSGDMEGSVIPRRTRDGESAMGDDGTWTIFVYLCGSDLESGNGAASTDMEEMLNAGASSNIKFVVETGGASEWYSDVSADQQGRYEISGGEITPVDAVDQANMGESNTLTSFLRWGIENYPAEKMGLIFWNHGSGSINGVCFDELASADSLYLREIDASLQSVFDEMTDKFEFIGFDACLMGTVETAGVMATHARYMVGSQEYEPGNGWNYTAIGEYLEQNPSANGAELGQVICDSFYESCAETGEEGAATLSVIDLSKVDPLITAFDSLSQDMYGITEDDMAFADFARTMFSADNFGGNNDNEGYTNMVDLGALIRAGYGIASEKSEQTRALLDEAVVYQIRGGNHSQASGLSVYYPLQIQGSTELSIFRDICVSSYYLGLVNKIAYGFGNAGSISASDAGAYESGSGTDYLLDGYEYDENSGCFGYTVPETDEYTYLDGQQSGASEAITFSVDPNIDENGVFNFTLTKEGLNNTASVQAQVYQFYASDEGYGTAVSLGLTSDVLANWETGEFSDNFDGTWFSLPDGQNLCAYLVEECDGYDVYTSPILLNGSSTNLRFTWNYSDGSVTILDTWDGVGATGAASRGTGKVSVGDVIIPCYDAYDLDADEELSYTGNEYTVMGMNLQFAPLENGIYLYSFYIDDVFGNYYESEFVQFEVNDGEIFFSEL